MKCKSHKNYHTVLIINLVTMSNKSEEKNLVSRAPVKWSKESDEELERLREESKASINWTEVAKWNADGRPYEEHEEILMFLNKNELTSLGSKGKPTDLYSTSCICLISKAELVNFLRNRTV